MSIGLHALHRAGSVLGEKVLITGAGTIGAMCVMAARLAGAAEITVCDVHDRALSLAKLVGADRVVRSDQVDVAALADSATSPSKPPAAPAALAPA